MNLLSRVRQIAMVSGVESLGVVAAGITGLLIVNVVPKDQYAIYTFLVTCMQLMLGIADLGLSNCALPIVGERNKEPRWVVGVCKQIFHRRWLMLGAAFLIVGPYVAYSFSQHGWFSPANVLAAVMVLVALLVTLRNHYANGVLLILGHIATISKVGFAGALVRFAFVGMVLLMPSSALSIAGLFLAVIATEAIVAVLYRKTFIRKDIQDQHLSVEQRRGIDSRILKIALPLVPSAIYFQVQGAVTIFLVSLFGTTEMLAEIGAFGRLAIVLTIVDRVAGILLFPVIARTPQGPKLASLVMRVHFVYLFTMAIFLSTGWLFPEYWILFLGEKYRSLTPYVWMMFLSSILMNAAGFAFLTMSVRGLTAKQGVGIIFVVTAQLAYLAAVGISDLRSVLLFGVVTCAAHFFYQYSLLCARWKGLRFAV
ncbi:hypothetical protein [Variovorax boronicumulans]|uniref:hypothetical protein n=1 Tax=Variovorax boronicumulans TaxID=436515 RepID=UPI001C58932D